MGAAGPAAKRPTQAKPVFRRSRNGLRPLPCPLLKSPPNAAARPLEKQEAGLISKPLKVGYHSVV